MELGERMRIKIDTGKMNALSTFRGVGTYAELLSAALKRVSHVQLVEENPEVRHYPFFDLFFHTLPILRKTKTVVTIHDVIPLVFPKQYKPGLRGQLRFFLQNIALGGVEAVVTDSECSKRDIAHYLGYPAEKIHAIYLAGNPEIKRQPKRVTEEIRKKYVLPERYVLYVGDINYNKNLPRLIEACSKLPQDISLVMVGRTLNDIAIPEGETLHKALDKFEMRARTVLLTEVPKHPAQDLAAIFTLAEVYVQPSLYEGFGLSVLDAMQCGIPVVSSNASSLPEVCGDAALYFDPKDVNEMAKKIQEAITLSVPERRVLEDKMEKNLKRFSWLKTAEETARAYTQAIGMP